MTYEQSAALMMDLTFRSRIKVACLVFAEYILGEATSTPAHVTRARWATNCFQSPDMTAQQVQPGVVMDGAVQEQGAEISDSALQGAVEITVNKIM